MNATKQEYIERQESNPGPLDHLASTSLLGQVAGLPGFPFVIRISNQLILWLMEPGGSMPHSQGPSNNPYSEPNQPNSSY